MTDLPWTPLIGVTPANYIADRHADRDAAGGRRVQRAALRARAVGGAARRRQGVRPTAPGYHQRYSASRSARPSGCRTAGWRGSGSRPTTGANTSTIRRRRSSIRRGRRRRQPPRPFAGPQVDGGSVVRSSTRQRQERHLHGRAGVSVRRQRHRTRRSGASTSAPTSWRARATPSRSSRATCRPAIRSAARPCCW